MPLLLRLQKNYRGKVMENGKKVSLRRFGANGRSRVRGFFFPFCHPIARATSYCLLPDAF